MENLLPGAEDEFAVLDRDRQRWAEHGGLQVRMAVAIVPGLFVSVIAAGREEFIQHGWQVFFKPRLEFYGADCAGAADIKDMRQA